MIALQQFAAVSNSAAGNPCTFTGALSATGTGSTTVTGTERTITVPSGNSGVLRFSSVNISLGNLQYSQNAGAWTSVSEGTEITLATSDTLACRGTLLAVGESVSGNLIDASSNALIEALSFTRTA